MELVRQGIFRPMYLILPADLQICGGNFVVTLKSNALKKSIFLNFFACQIEIPCYLLALVLEIEGGFTSVPS